MPSIFAEAQKGPLLQEARETKMNAVLIQGGQQL